MMPRPALLTDPVKVTLQVIGIWNDDGDFVTMVPVAVNPVLSGLRLTAFAIEAAPMHTAKADNDTRVFKLFIIFPHMLWRIISPGVMAMIERSRRNCRTSLSSQISIQLPLQQLDVFIRQL
jgi:hypothetical protein